MSDLAQSILDLLTGPRRSLAVLAVALIVIVPGLAAMPVTDRDEARFAQASKQMLETGDLIDIRLQEEPRWKKPAGIYWLQAGSATLFGGAEAPIWAYRLPSALAALAAALAMLWAASPLIGRQGAGLAGAMLATSLLFAAEANIAKTDAALMLTSVLTLGAMARLLLGQGGTGSALILWTALAAAILIKGPIVPVIALLTLAGLWLLTRQRPAVAALRPLWGLPLLLLLILPWLIAIWIVSDGAFFRESLGEDLIGKVAEGKEKHGAPPGLFTLLVWGTFWPWAALIPLALPWLWSERRARWLAVLIAWVVPFWLVLEAVPTKLPHYVLPLYPALAIMLAGWVSAQREGAVPPLWSRISSALVAGPGAILALAIIALPLAVEGRMVWSALPLALAGLAAVIWAGRAAWAGHLKAQIAGSLLAALCLYPAVLQFALPSLTTAFASPRMAAAAAPWQACADGPLVSGGYREPSLVFLTETATELALPAEIAEMLRTDTGRLFLIEDRWWPQIERLLPEGRPDLIERGAVTYFNYNRGKSETARLLTDDDPRWEACAATQ